MRWTRRAALLAATLAIVVLAACAPFKSGPPVNNERAANGLGPVAWNDQLGGLAQSWSDYMAVTGNYSHQDLDAVLQNPAYAGYSGLGENILHGGCGISAAQMDQAWMSSPLHRANILGNFSAVGIGVACNGGDLYATEEFGR